MRDYLIKTKIYLIFGLIYFVFISQISGAGSIIVRGNSLGRLASHNFRIKRGTEVDINGRGVILNRPGSDIISYGWILDADSQEIVWNSMDSKKNYYKDNGEFRISDRLRLNKGNYKLYFINVYEEFDFDEEHFNLGKLIGEIIKGLTRDDFSYHRLYLELETEESNIEENIDIPIIDENDYSVVSLLGIDENEYKKEQFSVRRPTELEISFTGERDDGKDYDYARIYELPAHKVVWPNQETRYNHAGGDEKNVQVNQTIILSPGDYEVSYVTDGSHSYDDWNTLPPKEPEMWGILITCQEKDKNNISDKVDKVEPLVDLRGAGNNDNLSQGFAVKKSMDLRVICLGEYIGDPYDYGWIENAKTRERIWEFDKNNTVHAGGDEKNKKFNDIIHFEKGKYILRYVSDDSHSYLSWNEAPPYEQELWGISVWPLDDQDAKYVELFDAEELEEKNVIVEIVRVGDSRELHEDFEIEESGKYRVYAIGEGQDHRMYDTGWIKNMDNELIVWEMTYRKTEHAGGAWKNRLYNGPVYLEKGKYRLYFKTDGSHSYNDWNSAPPRDQENYGIKILKE
jgi:hypothetical protein